MQQIIFEQEVFKVQRVSWEYDQDGVPVDIEIVADIDTLETIAKRFCHIGVTLDNNHFPYRALYARLDPFTVIINPYK